MYAQLGDIRFDLITYFDGLHASKKINYAEHPTIEGKPKLQYIGDALDSIEIKINLHRDFCDPESEYKKIVDNALKHEALPLVFGNGLYKGNYVIEEITSTAIQTFTDATIMAIDMDLKLKEWVRDTTMTMKKAKTTPTKTLKKKDFKTDVEPGSISRKKIVRQE